MTTKLFSFLQSGKARKETTDSSETGGSGSSPVYHPQNDLNVSPSLSRKKILGKQGATLPPKAQQKIVARQRAGLLGGGNDFNSSQARNKNDQQRRVKVQNFTQSLEAARRTALNTERKAVSADDYLRRLANQQDNAPTAAATLWAELDREQNRRQHSQFQQKDQFTFREAHHRRQLMFNQQVHQAQTTARNQLFAQQMFYQQRYAADLQQNANKVQQERRMCSLFQNTQQPQRAPEPTSSPRRSS